MCNAYQKPSILFKKINFRQNTAIWTQPMRTHNLTHAQDLGSYAQLIQSRTSLANKLRAQFCYARLCFVLSEFFFSIIDTLLIYNNRYSTNIRSNHQKRQPRGLVTSSNHTLKLLGSRNTSDQSDQGS